MEIPHFTDIGIDVCGSCNGLVCLSYPCQPIVLCKPGTREFKVAAFVTLHQREAYNFVKKAGIYNLSTNSRTKIDIKDQEAKDWPYTPHAPGPGILFRRASHWLNHRNIVYFDISSETFGCIRFFSNFIDPKEQEDLHLTSLNESLALIEYTNHATETKDFQTFNVWVMREYGVAQSWTKQFAVGPVTGILCPFLLRENEAILLGNIEEQLVSRAVGTQQMNGLDIRGVADTLRVMIYQESLVSIK